MHLTNPSADRSIIAPIAGEHYEIPAGETVEFDDYVIASTLVEYGAVAVPVELQAAQELWAERNRGINSVTASASSSEGKIIGRMQATVDVATGTLAPGNLKGEQLAAAVAAAVEAGAEIGSRLSADEKREALGVWQAQMGTSTPPGAVMGDRFKTDENGDLVLDDDGQPIPVDPSSVPAEAVTVPEGDLESRLVWVGEGETDEERRSRADAIYSEAKDSGSSEEDLAHLGEQLRAIIYPAAGSDGTPDGTDESGS